jgi:F-type H+-transporting ATPase subunit gamma
MASLKEIRKRIESVKTTQKTTSAMKMVSAAKLRRAQENFEAAKPYALELKRVISQIAVHLAGSNVSEETHELLPRFPLIERAGTPEQVRWSASGGDRVAVVLITTDRGLCGGFNSNLCKKVMRELDLNKIDHAQFTVIGRKGLDFFKRTDHTILHCYTAVPPTEHSEIVRTIMEDYIERFEKQEIDRLYLAYSHIVSVLTQEPIFTTLLPIEPATVSSDRSDGGPPLPGEVDEREILFEPSADQILDRLLRKYVENQVAVSWLDSIAGEHAARMTAMDSATKNAGELIEKLQLYYNRTRQAAITRELIEIISGAESL